jgi:hypothetical protein
MEKESRKKILLIGGLNSHLVSKTLSYISNDLFDVTIWSQEVDAEKHKTLSSLTTELNKLTLENDLILFIALERGKVSKYQFDSFSILSHIVLNTKVRILLVTSQLHFGSLWNTVPILQLSYSLQRPYAYSKFRLLLLLQLLGHPLISIELPSLKKNSMLFNTKFYLARLFFRKLYNKNLKFETFKVRDFSNALSQLICEPYFLGEKSYRINESGMHTVSLNKKYDKTQLVKMPPRLEYKLPINALDKLRILTYYDHIRLIYNGLPERKIDVKKHKLIFDIITPVSDFNSDFSLTRDNIINLARYFNFNWIVVTTSSAYSDIVENLKDVSPNFTVLKEGSLGIYGAYNTALKLQDNTSYYIPLSAGDFLVKDNMLDLNKFIIDKKPLVVFAPIIKHRKVIFFEKLSNMLRIDTGTHKFATGHSAACVMSQSVHTHLGLYDESYKLAADSKIFELIRKEFPDKIKYFNKLLGYFSDGGASQQHAKLAYQEHFRLRIEVGSPFLYEFILLKIRLIKYHSKKFSKNISLYFKK